MGGNGSKKGTKRGREGCVVGIELGKEMQRGGSCSWCGGELDIELERKCVKMPAVITLQLLLHEYNHMYVSFHHERF